MSNRIKEAELPTYRVVYTDATDAPHSEIFARLQDALFFEPKGTVYGIYEDSDEGIKEIYGPRPPRGAGDPRTRD